MNREALANKIVNDAKTLMIVVERYVDFYQRTPHIKIYQACNQLAYRLCNYADYRTVSEQPSFMLLHDVITEDMIEQAFQVLPGLTLEDVTRDKNLVKEGFRNIVKDVETLITLPVTTTQNVITQALNEPRTRLYLKIADNLTNMLAIVNRYHDFYARTQYTKTFLACAELRRTLLVYSNKNTWLLGTAALANLIVQFPISSETVNKAFCVAPGLQQSDVVRDKLAIKEGMFTLLNDAKILMNL